MKPHVIPGVQCGCGRDVVALPGQLKVCSLCSADVPACECGPVGLSRRGMELHTTAIARLVAEIRR
jgi:hypothetical protein